jgi:uncharacterized membrane protein (DUF106 family)
MDEENPRRAVEILEEIRANQARQLAQQAEGLALQREQFELVRRQAERTERIQERAERIQEHSAQLVGGARKAIVVILAIVTLLIAYLSWLLFR